MHIHRTRRHRSCRRRRRRRCRRRCRRCCRRRCRRRCRHGTDARTLVGLNLKLSLWGKYHR